MIRIVVRMGGDRRRFVERGDTFPRLLVEVTPQPPIEQVVRHLTPCEPHDFIFVSRNEHLHTRARHALGDELSLIAPGCSIISMPHPTADGLYSVLLALEHLCRDDELLIANSDQVVDAPIDRFLAMARETGWDGGVMTVPTLPPRWSSLREEGDGMDGIYYFRRGRSFVDAAERMLFKNASMAGELCLASVFRELGVASLRVGHFPMPASPAPVPAVRSWG